MDLRYDLLGSKRQVFRLSFLLEAETKLGMRQGTKAKEV